ncbi:MAG: chromosome segregation protein SMC [Anaerolineae bacterium]|nr:chromosome segregation protein SMC [Anaerolineae bacterium]
MMRLKHLGLLGYKTFASQVEFSFQGGITAIVGPNGSGKSNVADAIRWVLGEQSFSLLRAKKGEDMIFSGSAKRARMGMAEATLTLDNADNWLPVEFSEVTITRRSYRSGENEYLMNGSRVRLRDISDLLGKSGLSKRTYTVVGQGLIDTALSLRPQERRTLIEEAAGLTLYQSRRADALNKLEETQHNVLRVHDLMAEILPRMKQLERQAERAQEYELLYKELEDTHRIWYSYQWSRGREELQRIRTVARVQQERLDEQQALCTDLGAQITQIRSAQGELRRQLSEWHRASSVLHAQSETHQRDIAVAGERRRMLIQQQDQVSAESISLEAERAAQAERVSQAESELAALSETLDAWQAQERDIELRLSHHRQTVDALVAAQSAIQDELYALRTQVADHESRQSQYKERQNALQEEQSVHELARQSCQEKTDVLHLRLAALDGKLQEVVKAAQELKAQIVSEEERIVQAQQQQQEQRGQLNTVEQRLGRLRERYDVLTRMREEGAGLYDGVRNVLQAAGEQGTDRLAGVIGTVAEAIRVPRELETAIEVALGGQLQDVIVQSWNDAQAAIGYLKRTRGGRATFLPLDTLRPGEPLRTPQLPGVIGLASELVDSDVRLRSVVTFLLGRTVVCQDLPAARHALDRIEGHCQIVTIEGEIVRSSGAVTGGTRGKDRQSGMLAREREWRELPEQVLRLETVQKSVLGALDQAIAREKAARTRMDELVGARTKLDDTQRTLVQERDQAQRQVDQLAQEIKWSVSRVESVVGEWQKLEARCETLQQQLVGLNAQIERVEARFADLETQIENADDSAIRTQLAECRAEGALMHQEQASKQAELHSYRQGLRQVEQRLNTHRERSETLSAQLRQTDQDLEQVRQQESDLSAKIQAYTDQIVPAETKLTDLEGQQARLESAERQARTRQQDLESRYSHVGLQVSRQEEQMKNLQRQIEDDLGLVALDMGDDLSGQPLLPLGSLVSSLPQVDVLPEGLEDQIHALKRRLRRLGAVNPDAPQDFQQVSERHAFLSSQAADLKQASEQLHQVIAELDAVMEREFNLTFKAVAREFKNHFTKLFNGGSARLQLTNPDDLMTTGIDIVAQPPGKRQQGLALLSGGERALTAAALIFSILTISPTPFCVLDEVDAALDEANVGRFRSVLQSLAEQTQFVIITHNRYTIEIADIVYGVSMGDDGVSCVISHRMKD